MFIYVNVYTYGTRVHKRYIHKLRRTLLFSLFLFIYIPTYVLAIVKYADGCSGIPHINPVLGRTARRDPEEDD